MAVELTVEAETNRYLTVSQDEIDQAVPLHTSDRILYKRCRRKWDYSASMRQHLTPDFASSDALWLGSGFHFALEDLHGPQHFGTDITAALQAYKQAWKTGPLPALADELVDQADGMLQYYKNLWLPRRNVFHTVYLDDNTPCVEVSFNIVLPTLSKLAGKLVVYRGTFDRIVVDENGQYWIMDYKTARTFDTGKLLTDPQITSYLWAASLLFDFPIQGVILQQFKKTIPTQPKPLKSGGISAAANQTVSYGLYKAALEEAYGSTTAAPDKNQVFLDKLLEQETLHSDAFIRRDLVVRTKEAIEAEYMKILMEGKEMLDPHLALYPNPTKDCSWDCPFRNVCIAEDDLMDPQELLQQDFSTYEDEFDWRKHLILPRKEVN